MVSQEPNQETITIPVSNRWAGESRMLPLPAPELNLSLRLACGLGYDNLTDRENLG